MGLWVSISDLLSQRELLDRQIQDAQLELERRTEAVKTEYLMGFLRYPPELVDAILSDPATLESYYIAYERFKTLGISLDPQTPSWTYSREIPLSFTREDVRFWIPVSRIAVSELEGAALRTSPDIPVVWVLPAPPPQVERAPWTGDITRDLMDPTWSWQDASPDPAIDTALEWVLAIKDGFIENIRILSLALKQEITVFFQEGLDKLENTWVSTWQQRIDTLITWWNTRHTNQRLYRYVSGKNERKSAGNLWKEKYGIVDIESFQQVLGVRCPSWFQKRGTPRTKVASPRPSARTQVPAKNDGVDPAVSASWNLSSGWGDPIVPWEKWVSGWGDVGSKQDVSERKLTDAEAREVITRDFIAILNVLFPKVLESYKKERKGLGWQLSGFTWLHIQDNEVTTREGGNPIRGKYLAITIGKIPEDQKPYWEALSSSTWRDIISRIFMQVRWQYNLPQAYLNNFTGSPLEWVQQNDPVLRLMTWSDLSLYFYLPTKTMVSQKKDWSIEKWEGGGERKNSDQLALLWLIDELEWYLDWYFDTVLSNGKWILKEGFTEIDIVLWWKTIDAAKWTTELSAKLWEKSKKFSAQRDALHNFVQLNEYIQAHPESNMRLKQVDGSQPIRIVYGDPDIPGLTIEFSPY